MRLDDNWCDRASAMLPDGNYLVCSLDRRYSHDDLKGFNFVASATTGTDHIDARDIPLISLKGDPFLRDVWATAEHTFALILSLLRYVLAAHNHVCQGGFDREMFRGTELQGKTLGIVGYGRVGRQVEQIACGFGMTPLRCDKGVSPVGWEIILQSSDILTVHVALNDSAKGMFNADAFSQMKPTAYFINTSRGAVVDEDALLDALQSGSIRGAALDVFCDEPNIHEGLREYARTHDNLILTPHLGGNTVESREKTQVHVAEKIRDYLRGDG